MNKIDRDQGQLDRYLVASNERLYMLTGWFTKPDRCKGTMKEVHCNYFLSDFQFSGLTKAVIAYMKSNRFVQEAVDKQLKKTHDEGRKLRSDNMIVWIDDASTVPAGWKGSVTEIRTKSDITAMQWFLSSEGNCSEQESLH